LGWFLEGIAFLGNLIGNNGNCFDIIVREFFPAAKVIVLLMHFHILTIDHLIPGCLAGLTKQVVSKMSNILL
jgi:hypothetical protein